MVAYSGKKRYNKIDQGDLRIFFPCRTVRFRIVKLSYVFGQIHSTGVVCDCRQIESRALAGVVLCAELSLGLSPPKSIETVFSLNVNDYANFFSGKRESRRSLAAWDIMAMLSTCGTYSCLS